MLTTAHVPSQVAHAATSSVAAADLTGGRLGGQHGGELIAAAHSAFVTSMSVGMRVAAGVALVSAVGAFVALAPRRRLEQADDLTSDTASLAPAVASTPRS